MNFKRIIKMFLVFCAASALYTVWTKDLFIRSHERFLGRVGRSPLAVVLFYAEERRRAKNPALREQQRELRRIFRGVSATSIYKEADILFARINTAQKRTEDLHKQYAITQLPACVLFKNGEPVYDTQGSIVGLAGFSEITHANLKKIIEIYFTQDIQRILKNKAVIRQRQLEEAQMNALYWGPYWWGGAYW